MMKIPWSKIEVAALFLEMVWNKLKRIYILLRYGDDKK